MAYVNVHANSTYPKAGGVSVKLDHYPESERLREYFALHITAEAEDDTVVLFLTPEQVEHLQYDLTDRYTAYRLQAQIAERRQERDKDAEQKMAAFGVNATRAVQDMQCPKCEGTCVLPSPIHIGVLMPCDACNGTGKIATDTPGLEG